MMGLGVPGSGGSSGNLKLTKQKKNLTDEFIQKISIDMSRGLERPTCPVSDADLIAPFPSQQDTAPGHVQTHAHPPFFNKPEDE